MDHSKRQSLGLNGLLPARVETLAIQKNRAMRVLRSKHNLLEKYILMAQLRTNNVRLFYNIVIDELEVSPFYLLLYSMTNVFLGTCSRNLYSDCWYSLS